MPEDPQTRTTTFITTGEEATEQKTRMISKEQLAMDMAFFGAGDIPELEVPHMKAVAFRSELVMMSYQGRRSDDIVEMTKGLEEKKLVAAGVQKMEELARYKHGRKGSSGPD